MTEIVQIQYQSNGYNKLLLQKQKRNRLFDRKASF